MQDDAQKAHDAVAHACPCLLSCVGHLCAQLRNMACNGRQMCGYKGTMGAAQGFKQMRLEGRRWGGCGATRSGEEGEGL
jgi:hypothetical protein